MIGISRRAALIFGPVLVIGLGAGVSTFFLAARQSDRPLLLGILGFLSAGLVALAAMQWPWRSRPGEEEELLGMTRSLLRSLDQGVVVADKHGNVQLVNDAARTLVGDLGDTMSRLGWAPAGVGCLVGDPDAPEARGSLPLDRAIRGEHFEDEEFFVRSQFAPDGLWLRVSGAPLRSAKEEAIGGVVVFRDMTDAKAQDDRLKRLTAAVDQAADVIFITDREGTILYVNRGFEDTTGFASEDVLGSTPRVLKSNVHGPEHYRTMWGTILRGDVYRGSTVNRKKDGSVWHGEQSVTPMKDTQGQVTHFVSVTKDMTERLQLQEREAEMRLAGVVQQRLYPQSSPPIEGLDLAGVVHPAAEACGDYFDFIALSDGAVGLVIGDVSGHGLGPALIMVETRAHLRSLLGAGASIEDALTILNGILCEDMPDDHFVSLLLARLDPQTRQLTYVNAGHPPAAVVGACGTVRAELMRTGPALGVIRGATYGPRGTVDLDEGDVVVLVTDGLTEMQSPSGELYESERVLQVVREQDGDSAEAILEALHASARAFAAGRTPEDDLTMLVCKVYAEVPDGVEATISS